MEGRGIKNATLPRFLSLISRGGGAFSNVGAGGGGGAHLPLSHAYTPPQIFHNTLGGFSWHKQTSFQSSQCLVCPSSICDNASVGSCSTFFRRSCFIVLLRWFLSRLRAENVRSEVADVTGNVNVCRLSTPVHGMLRSELPT